MPESADTSSWDTTYPAYYQLADVIKSVAESHSHVSVDDTTLLRWREIMGVMREIDTHFDDTPASPETILVELSGFERFRGRYPHITPEVLGMQTHARLIMRTERILKLGGFVSEATTPYRYIRLRAAEAVQTAELFADSASDAVLAQPGFAKSFMPGLRSLGVAACLLDSAHDAATDYIECKSDIEPTLAFRAQALAASARHTLPFLPLSFHIPVIKQLWRAAHIRSDRKRYAAK